MIRTDSTAPTFWRRWFAWWRDLSRVEAITAVGVMVAITSTVVYLLWPGSSETSITTGDVSTDRTEVGLIVQGVQGDVTIGFSEETHRQALADREARVRAEMAQARGEELARLTAQLQEIQRDRDNLAESYARSVEELRVLRLRLDDFDALLPRERIEAAQEALYRGDRSVADALLAEVQGQTANTLTLAAEASYLRGGIAEQEIRWHDAARHYAEAARISPGFEYLLKALQFTRNTGDYPAALRHGEDLLRLARMGESRESLASALNAHALTLHDIGRFAEAEPLFREALKLTRETLGPRHPSIAGSLNNLAGLRQMTGRFTGAEALYREALSIGRETRGPRSPEVAGYLNNLALLLGSTGRGTLAEPLYREALDIQREIFGSRHPEVAGTLDNLAGLLADTERWAEAEPLHREALDIIRETLGPRHPRVAGSLNNLALTLHDVGRFAEAEAFHREALEIRRERLGSGHPRVAVSLNNLALVLEDTGRFAEAEALQREALEIRRETLGLRHSSVAVSVHNLAGLLRQMGRAEEATPLFLEALAIWREIRGDTHPNTREVAHATLSHLRTYAPDHPDLPVLAAVFDGDLRI